MSRRPIWLVSSALLAILVIWPIVRFQANVESVKAGTIVFDVKDLSNLGAVIVNGDVVTEDATKVSAVRDVTVDRHVAASISRKKRVESEGKSVSSAKGRNHPIVAPDLQSTASQQIDSGDVDASQPPTSPYAYVFAIWRLDPDNPSYKGYLASMLIATRILRLCGSTADFVLVIKLHYNSSHRTLPQEDLDLLEGMKIRVCYLPQGDDDRHLNIYGTMFHKFTIFNLTEYRQVMYLDSDVMPMNNLDYLMEQADHGFLKHHVVVASNREPSNGGMIIVKPNATVYQDIQRIIQSWGSRLGRGKEWDNVIGWGHTIEPPDRWETNTKKVAGTQWDFWAANADQGFLYHLCKYVLKDCTQILARKVINFGPRNDTDGVNENQTRAIVQIERQWNVTSLRTSPFATVAHKPVYDFSPGNCGYTTSFSSPNWPGCVPPYSDFRHYTGKSKPWKQDRPATKRRRKPTSSDHLWWQTLVELRDEEGLNASSLGIPLPY